MSGEGEGEGFECEWMCWMLLRGSRERETTTTWKETKEGASDSSEERSTRSECHRAQASGRRLREPQPAIARAGFARAGWRRNHREFGAGQKLVWLTCSTALSSAARCSRSCVPLFATPSLPNPFVRIDAGVTTFSPP